jgi:hypothetical protein
MLTLLLASTLPWLSPTLLPALPPLAATAQPGDEKAVKALEAWLKFYRTGKLEFRSKDNISKDSIALKFGLAPKSGLGTPTWAGDLETILEAVARQDDAAAAQALLDVAAIGLDQGKYTLEMAPSEVRDVGERWLAKLSSTPARDELAKAARGELKAEKARATALQVAGVRGIGLCKDGSFRGVVEQALADDDELVRVVAAEALAVIGDDNSGLALVRAIEKDTNDAVLVAATKSLRSLYQRHMPKAAGVFEPSPDKPKGDAPAGGTPAGDAKPAAPAPAALPENVRRAVVAAIGALGRSTWRGDMELVRLLDDFRTLDAVPALIGVLERFTAHPEDIKTGKTSGLLWYQAYELLTSLTGASIPLDQPAKWREFWQAEKDKLVVGLKKEAKAGATSAGGFCGIPVEGTRVVFVLDLSGSMQWPMDEQDAEGKKKQSKRLDFAQRELKRAMDIISPNAHFNLITFNGNPKPEVWSKELVQATEKNRERFKKYVDGLRADGGTNLWSGLEEALKIKTLAQTNRYASNIDELFVLSDGAPTVGEVLDPIEMLRLVQESNRYANVRINTVFISSATPPEFQRSEPHMSITPQELMRRMAEQNYGKFREL